MNARLQVVRCVFASASLVALFQSEARAFWGVADTSFVTVIANPAEAANWAAELDRMSAELSTAQGALQVAADMRTYAGDPKAAVAALPDLSVISSGALAIGGGVATQADLAQAWQALGSGGQAASEASLLQDSGSGSSMTVFGQQQARNLALYGRMASDAASAGQIRGQAAREQAVRALVASSLAAAWVRFRSATTESSKQSILAEISQLQSQDQLMTAHRRALLDDLDLADREKAAGREAISMAADEQGLAQSAALNAAESSRAQAAESQRVSTLQKSPPVPAAVDYSGLKLWTTADASGSAN